MVLDTDFHAGREAFMPIEVPVELLGRVIKLALNAMFEAEKDPVLLPFEDKIFNEAIALGFPNSQDDEKDNLLGCKKDRGHDLTIEVPSRAATNIGHVKQFIEKLKKELPGIEISTSHKNNLVMYNSPRSDIPQDIAEIPDDSEIPDQFCIHIGKDLLIKALERTDNAYYKDHYSYYRRLVNSYNHASQMSAVGSSGFTVGSYYCASILKGDISDTPYFPIQELPKLLVGRGRKIYKIATLFNDAICRKFDPEEIVDFLAQNNIDELSYIASGADNIAFRATTDNHGNSRMCVLGGFWENVPNSPFHLPAYSFEHIGPVRARVMSELSREDLEFAEKELLDILRELRLSVRDIRQCNVGFYQFEDCSGRQNRVPMILDWGGGPAYLDQEEQGRVGAHADRLRPWYAAQDHIRQVGQQQEQKAGFVAPGVFDECHLDVV